MKEGSNTDWNNIWKQATSYQNFPKIRLPKKLFNYSTLDEVTKLEVDTQEFTANYSTICIFLDIQEAYDNIQLHILLNKMMQLRIPDTLIYNICNLHHYRNVC